MRTPLHLPLSSAGSTILVLLLFSGIVGSSPEVDPVSWIGSRECYMSIPLSSKEFSVTFLGDIPRSHAVGRSLRREIGGLLGIRTRRRASIRAQFVPTLATS